MVEFRIPCPPLTTDSVFRFRTTFCFFGIAYLINTRTTFVFGTRNYGDPQRDFSMPSWVLLHLTFRDLEVSFWGPHQLRHLGSSEDTDTQTVLCVPSHMLCFWGEYLNKAKRHCLVSALVLSLVFCPSTIINRCLLDERREKENDFCTVIKTLTCKRRDLVSNLN